MKMVRGMGAALLAAACWGQQYDLGSRFATAVSRGTEGKLTITFEQRGRYETRDSVGFAKDKDLATGLLRTRVGLAVKPVKWLQVSAMMQDGRAPWYGENAPNSVREGSDLQEAFVELFPGQKTGFGMTAGRRMLNYGDTRLIGSPQWGNLARTYDHARVYYKLPRAQLEFLYVSPVKVRIGEFNRPVLGDHVYGMYNVFPEIVTGVSLHAYVLRHDQNRPGGFTGGSQAAGTDRLGTNTFGGRLSGPVAWKVNYIVEMAYQTGKAGAARHRGFGSVLTLSRRWKVAGRNLDASGEYKYASGTKDPADLTRVSTFDQMYPAGHDKLGHQDLFGWRNILNARSVVSYALTKSFTWNVMFDDSWLATSRDALYNGQGRPIARSADGSAGRHVGLELDTYVVYKYKHFQFGGGYGYLWDGAFLKHTTPGLNPSYAYLFHSYSF